MSAGVFSSLSIGSLKNAPDSANTADTTRIPITAVFMLVLRSMYFFAPKNFPATTVMPIDEPVATARNIIVTEYDALIAYNDSPPTNLPTIAESAILYNC